MGEDHEPEQLLASQAEREALERERARISVDEQEALQHERRADKASYLRQKLEEQVEANQST